MIRIVPRIDSPQVRDAVQAIHSYALICLTSPNGARLLFEALADSGRDARALANATIAAIGPGTAAALAEHGIAAGIVPERSIAEALVAALAHVEVVAGRCSSRGCRGARRPAPGPEGPRSRGGRCGAL